MFISTPRLTLRPFSDDDQGEMIEMLTNDIIKQTYMIPDFDSEEQVIQLFKRYQELSLKKDRFVVGIDLDGKLIGFMNDTGIKDDYIELGYVIAPKYHKKGYCTEALKAAIAYLFDQGFRTVAAAAFEDNIASRRVMEKAGMKRLDREESIEYRGVTHRCICYEVTK